MLAVESVQTLSLYFAPKSLSSDRIPIPAAVAVVTPTISASPEDNEIDGWVLLQDLRRCPPSIAQPPEVDLRVRRQPAQSVSENTSSVPVCCHLCFGRRGAKAAFPSSFVDMLEPDAGRVRQLCQFKFQKRQIKTIDLQKTQ